MAGLLLENAKKLRERVALVNRELKEKNTWKPDPNVIHTEIGKTYKVRLLWATYDDPQMSGPFIEYYIHKVPTESGNNVSVVCAKTDIDSKWWEHDKICDHTGTLYNSPEDSPDKKLYFKIKSQFHGFVPVFVIDDPTTPENNGKVKLLHYTKGIKDFFARDIFNIGSAKDEEEVVGAEAFDFPLGYNLNIEVTKNDNNNRKYIPEFSRKKTNIDVNVEYLKEELEKIQPEKYIKHHDENKITEVFNTHIIGITASAEVSTKQLPEIPKSGIEKNVKKDNPQHKPIEELADDIDDLIYEDTPVPSSSSTEKIDDLDDIDSLLDELNLN